MYILLNILCESKLRSPFATVSHFIGQQRSETSGNVRHGQALFGLTLPAMLDNQRPQWLGHALAGRLLQRRRAFGDGERRLRQRQFGVRSLARRQLPHGHTIAPHITFHRECTMFDRLGRRPSHRSSIVVCINARVLIGQRFARQTEITNYIWQRKTIY